MKKLVRYNLELLTVFLAFFCLLALLTWQNSSDMRKFASGYMLLYILHEWEEGRFPGGFYDLFFSRLHLEQRGDPNAMHVPVALLLTIITVLPWIFDRSPLFLILPISLAFFEGFIHTFGIVMMRMKKPYTPGMITAWLMFAFSLFVVRRLTAPLPIWILGILLMIVLFIVMQRTLIHLAGYTYRDFFAAAKKHILRTDKRH